MLSANRAVRARSVRSRTGSAHAGSAPRARSIRNSLGLAASVATASEARSSNVAGAMGMQYGDVQSTSSWISGRSTM